MEPKEKRRKDTEKLQELIENLPNRILNSSDDLNSIFIRLSDSPQDQRHKIKVVDIVLEVLRTNQASLNHCGLLVSRVRLELPRLPTEAVVRWCNDSVESIINDSDVNMIWCDILPECLNTLSSLNSFEYNGATVTVSDYKAHCLKKILECQWKERQLVRLAAMFKDIQLTKQEHRQCVIQLCTFFKETPPSSLPPLVHQLLQLCHTYNMDVVFAHLSHYFNLQLYSKLAAVTQDSESTTMYLDDIEQYSTAELYSCMSTCVLYVTHHADAVRRQLRAWPRSQLPREPFLLVLGLAMADKGKEFRTVCLDVIRSAIEQSVMDDVRSKESAWVRLQLHPDFVLDELLKELVDSSSHHASTMVGLIELGFALLECGRGRGAEARVCSRLAATLLARLAKAHPRTADRILSQLNDRLAVDCTHTHHAECLRLLCKRAPQAVEQSSQLCSIVEMCQPSSAAVLEAVHPLLNYSARVRDSLITACRKGLYSGNSASRCLAVCGILTVLRHLRVSGAPPTLNQDVEDTASQTAYSSQYADVHATQQYGSVSSGSRNMTICLEMVGILQRCFGQDASVKQLLYSRWYWCVKDNPGLHKTILEMLNEHIVQYLPEEGEVNLLIDKCVHTNAVNPLIEPIGYLLYLIAQLVQAGNIESDLERIFASQEDGGFIRTKLRQLLDDLSKCDLLAQFDMTNLKLTEATPESKGNCVKVQQILQVYEALIAHNILQWSPTKGNAEIVYSLYKAYNQLVDNTKPPTKAAKKASKLNETQESTKSAKSRKGQAEKKDPKVAKDKSGPFKPLPCLWDLELCYRVLELLHCEEVAWSSEAERVSLRGRGVLQRWAPRAVASALAALAALSTSSAVNAASRAQVLRHAPRIAAVLFARCLCQFEDLCDNDMDSALGCLEAFHGCLNLFCLPQYHSDVEMFLSKMTGNSNASGGENKAKVLIEVRKSLANTVQYATSQSVYVTNKKIVKELADIAVTLLKMPTNFHIHLSQEISKVEEMVRWSGQDCMSLLVQLLATSAAENYESTLLDYLFTRMGEVLGTVGNDQDTATQSTQDERIPFSWVTSSNVQALVGHVCAHVQTRLECVKHVLTRAKDLATALTVAVDVNRPGIEKERIGLLEALTIQLCLVARWAQAVCELRGVAAAFRGLDLAARLYTLAVSFVKLLDMSSARQAKLENLVKCMGNPLTSAVRGVREQLEGAPRGRTPRSALLPRLVRLAESFRAALLRLDKKGELNYIQYVSDRIPMGMKLQTDNEEDNGMDLSGDETRDESQDIVMSESEEDED